MSDFPPALGLSHMGHLRQVCGRAHRGQQENSPVGPLLQKMAHNIQNEFEVPVELHRGNGFSASLPSPEDSRSPLTSGDLDPGRRATQREDLWLWGSQSSLPQGSRWSIMGFPRCFT